MYRVFCLLLALHAAPLAAQQTAPLAPQQTDSVSARALVERAKRGNWFLRFTSDTAVAQGRITFLHADTAVSLGRQQVRLNEINRIERRIREGSAATPGAIGGGLLTGGLGLWAAAAFCANDCDHTMVLGTAAGAAIGIAIGGLIGTVIDPGGARWLSLWPDSIRVAEVPSPTTRGLVTAQVGIQVVDGHADGPSVLPTFFSLHISRDHGPLELTPLGFTAAVAKGDAGFVGIEAGLIYRFLSPVYVGCTAGVATTPDRAKPIASIRFGLSDGTSPLRVELRLNSVLVEGLRPTAHVVLGYSMRPWVSR